MRHHQVDALLHALQLDGTSPADELKYEQVCSDASARPLACHLFKQASQDSTMFLQFLGPASSRGQHVGPVPDWAAEFGPSGAHLQRPPVPPPHWALDGSLRQQGQAAIHPPRRQTPLQELVTNPWADEFARMNSARLGSGSAAHSQAGWAHDFALARSRLQPGAAEPLWPAQALADHPATLHPSRLQLGAARPPPEADGHPQAPWVSDFLQLGAPPGAQRAQQGAQQPLPGAAWAEEFQEAGGAQWAHDFQAEQQQALTPEQLKRRRGPQADDPLEDPHAPSWVRQFNEEMVHPTANAGGGESPTLWTTPGIVVTKVGADSHSWQAQAARASGHDAASLFNCDTHHRYLLKS